MSTNDCRCGTAVLDRGAIERPRFFPRQLVTPDDLTLGQEYFRNKLRRMVRYLHGWGTVCGAKVVPSDPLKPWKVVIQTGYLLGPYGDEIVLDHEICFDLRTRCVAASSGDACTEVVDPLCPDQTLDAREASKPAWIAVRYKEMASRPVRVQPVGCGCDDTACEYSRWRDGYEICVLDACPDSHKGAAPDWDPLIHAHGLPKCPACPTDPWVVLAKVEFDDKGNVKTIDNCSCRRMVLSLAPFWTRCNEPVTTVGGTGTSTGTGGTTPPVS
jgi:hypothetical protein